MKTKIPMVNLNRQYEKYANDFNRILTETAGTCGFIMGKELQAFEEHFAQYLGVRQVVGVGSGTDALILILKAVGYDGNSVVLTQDNTFIATTLAITSSGGKVALADIDKTTYSMEPESYNGPDPEIVLPVHLYGFPFDVQKIKPKFPDAIIIEDSCQAHGSSINGKKCGSLGLAAAFSFYPGKNLGAFGDGGAVATDDDSLAEEIKFLRNWGSKVKYIHEREGGNSRLDTIQAAVLDFKLKHLDEWNRKRNQLAELYRQNLSGADDIILPPESPAGVIQNYHLFVIRTPNHNRDLILQKLSENNIFAGIHYPLPIHLQKVYSEQDFARGQFPVATDVAKQIISLPIFPEMTEDEVNVVSETLLTILCKNQ